MERHGTYTKVVLADALGKVVRDSGRRVELGKRKVVSRDGGLAAGLQQLVHSRASSAPSRRRLTPTALPPASPPLQVSPSSSAPPTSAFDPAAPPPEYSCTTGAPAPVPVAAESVLRSKKKGADEKVGWSSDGAIGLVCALL